MANIHYSTHSEPVWTRDTLIESLEAIFEHIHATRMTGIPILNPKLRVQALGFKPWQNGRLGILITQWFMNICLFPLQKQMQAQVAVPVGSKQVNALPSGLYEFTLAYEPELGFYQSCTLFSPVLEFADQVAATKTAEIALIALMNPSLDEGSEWSQAIQQDIQQQAEYESEQSAPTSLLAKTLSRRELLQIPSQQYRQGRYEY